MVRYKYVQGEKTLHRIAKTMYERTVPQAGTENYIHKRKFGFDFDEVRSQTSISAAAHATLFQAAPVAVVDEIATVETIAEQKCN